MAKETSHPSHEQALAVLEAAAQDGTLSEAHQARLAELTGQGVRSDITEAIAAIDELLYPHLDPNHVRLVRGQAHRIVVTQPQELKELVESLKLEEGYIRALDTQKCFQLLKGEKAPDFGQVLKTFTPEMLAAARNFQNPELRLVTKGRSFNDLIAAMNAHKTIPDQRNAYVEKEYKKHADLKPENWGAHIIEAPKNADRQDFDDITLTLGERLTAFTKYKETAKVGGMDRLKYAHLMMQAMMRGKPIDDESWTMLDEDPRRPRTGISNAVWASNNGWVVFRYLPRVCTHDGIRLRRSVGGDVPNA